MAHFAQIDINNEVIQVIVVNNETLNHLEFPESEPLGIEFCQSLYGPETMWRQTSYNSSFRFNYAGIGGKYDDRLDGFIPINPHNGWVLNESTLKWESPTPYPSDGHFYLWNDELEDWELIAEIPKP